MGDGLGSTTSFSTQELRDGLSAPDANGECAGATLGFEISGKWTRGQLIFDFDELIIHRRSRSASGAVVYG
jgi:hypothetical protein